MKTKLFSFFNPISLYKTKTIIMILMLGLLLNTQALYAQYQNNAWFRGTISTPLSSKITLDTEGQLRRQSSMNTSDFFGEPLMYSYRNWLHYQHQPNLKFSLSPFAYFHNEEILQENTDLGKAPKKRLRFSAAVEMHFPLVKNLYLIERSAVEYHLFLTDNDNVSRFRNRIGLKYNLPSSFSITATNEFIVNTSGVPIEHFFNQNRWMLNLEYKIIDPLKIDIGYIHNKRLPKSNFNTIYEHNLYLNLTYKLFSNK